MLLKRLYEADAAGNPRNIGVALIHTGTHPEQNFSRKYVENAVAEGWMSLVKGKVVIHAVGVDLPFTIVRGPGRWCCHCGEKLSDDDHPLGALARKHVTEKHPGAESPDKSNPAGYRLVGGYETVLDAEQHAKFKAVPGAPLTLHAIGKNAIEAKRRRRAAKAVVSAAGMVVCAVALLLAGVPPEAAMLAANFVFNMSKGRAAELYNRVDSNDPAAATIIVIPLESAGLEAQSALEDSDTHAEVIDGTTNEATTGGWNRKTLADTDISAFAPDDTNNRVDIIISDQTWTAVSGNASGALTVNYASVASPADTAITPLTHHDFAVTPDGSDITADVPATGFFRAT